MFDQLMALKWVNDNIEQFGGNPKNITLMGGSAGACSVSLHLLSPLSQDLFSQAIMQSASALVSWGVISKEEGLVRGLRLAELMDCPNDRENIGSSIDCLRKANASEIISARWCRGKFPKMGFFLGVKRIGRRLLYGSGIRAAQRSSAWSLALQLAGASMQNATDRTGEGSEHPSTENQIV